MDIPIDLPFLGQLGVLYREDPLRDNGRDNDVNECICEKRAEDFVDVEGKSREMEVVCERLYGFTEP